MFFRCQTNALLLCALAFTASVGCSKKPDPPVVVEPAPKPPEQTKPIVPAKSVDPDRQAAEWVLRMGGAVLVHEGEKEINVRAIAELPERKFKLASVHLNNNARLTDENLTELKFVRPGILGIQNTSITDAGLANLVEQVNLGALSLEGTKITDTGLIHLKGMTKLNNLILSRTQVTGAGFQNLAGNVFTLVNLDSCPVADGALKHFAKLPTLYVLDLSKTPVTDRGLAHLSACQKLNTIHLNETQITDQGLRSLQSMASLKSLTLRGTKVTDAGVQELQKALPQCKIER